MIEFFKFTLLLRITHLFFVLLLKQTLELEGNTLRIHPSLNTLHVTVDIFIEDASGSDLSSVNVQLSYQSDKFLPEEPLFHFKGMP